MPYPIINRRSAGDRIRFYGTIVSLTITGCVWVGLNFHSAHLFHASPITICPFKMVSGFPCPSCGGTRAILLLLQGNFQESIILNPLGIFMALGLVGIPLWSISDFLFSKQSLYTFYLTLEEKLRKEKKVFIPLILLILMNWVWNIIKGI